MLSDCSRAVTSGGSRHDRRRWPAVRRQQAGNEGAGDKLAPVPGAGFLQHDGHMLGDGVVAYVEAVGSFRRCEALRQKAKYRDLTFGEGEAILLSRLSQSDGPHSDAAKHKPMDPHEPHGYIVMFHYISR